MEKIPIGLLNAFITFNDSKNIMDAANRLGISQPGLSKQLRQLEDKLLDPIFMQKGRKKVLTPFGIDLHRRIKDKIGNIQEVIEEARTLRASAKGATIRIVGRRGILDRFSSKLRFGGKLHFSEASNEIVLDSLLGLRAEIGIAHTTINSHELIAKPLFSETFQLVIPKKFSTGRPKLEHDFLSKLIEYPCLGYGFKDEVLKAVLGYHSVPNKEIHVVRATENYFSLGEMVEAELGWAILPSYIKVSERENWVTQIPSAILPSRKFFVVYRPEFSSVSWFRDLVLEIRSCFQ